MNGVIDELPLHSHPFDLWDADFDLEGHNQHPTRRRERILILVGSNTCAQSMQLDEGIAPGTCKARRYTVMLVRAFYSLALVFYPIH